jgi:hypothetical protein
VTSRLETDGVATILHPGRDGLLAAQLTFAVGAANEPLALRGVTHVIEHLAMFAARDTPVEINAEVDLETTNFYASGTPDRVVRFLRDVCTALGELPLDRLMVEKGVLEAEGRGGPHPIVATLLAHRYGAQYAGSVLFAGAGTAALTAEQVSDFARAWYVSGNALLHLTGPVPVDLDLPLLHGQPPDRKRPVGRLGSGPVMITAEDLPASGAGVMLRLPWDDTAHHRGHVIEILRGRIEDECRHRAGHAYTIDVEFVTATDGIDAVIYADAREGKETAVAQAVVKAVNDLALSGPDARELTRSVEALQEAWSVDGASILAQSREAMYRILGLPEAPPIDATAATTVDPAGIQRWVADALSTAVFYVEPEALAVLEDQVHHVPLCATVDELPVGHVFKPHILVRTLFRNARAARLVRTATGIAAADPDGIHVIDLDSIAGVMLTEDSGAVVIGRNGCVITLGDDLFRGSHAVLQEILSSVDSALVFDDPDLHEELHG